ncbi:histidine phosphatase family protein [Clavibacter sp. MX14-G9D]|uniref:histidine phosphatase family protein n=1 Tax=Clavibacter sp. MX14-G9D TaxID=3064656 RepID=UPI00293EFB56|nr:histidine phosphatase family protein [Clavibacter sp. MX14-G9D]
MTRIVLVRHGRTAWNVERRVQGSSDIPLDDTGRAQAATAGALLAEAVSGGSAWDAVYASPLSRAFETASIIVEHLALGGAPTSGPVPEAALAERRYGLAEGLTHAEIEARFLDGDVPGRETVESVTERAGAALVRLAVRHPGGSVVAVSHGGVIAALARSLDPSLVGRPGPMIENGSAHTFGVVDGELSLLRFGGVADLGAIADLRTARHV